jgi:hypothetical protein
MEGVSHDQILPRGLQPQDIPVWWTSLVETKGTKTSELVRNRWEAHLRKILGLKKAAYLTVGLAPRARFNTEDLFHVKWMDVAQNGFRISVSGHINDMRFAPEHLHRWDFTVWCDSVRAAKRLCSAITGRRNPTLLVGDHRIKAILARNGERWEACGLPLSAVLKLAKTLKVSFRRTAREKGNRYSFLIKH